MASVLIVDDSLFTIESLTRILISEGHTIAGTAQDGIEAYEMYKDLKPDLVTMDIAMPAVGGITAMNNIIRDFPEAKVIMISARGRDFEIFKALEDGARLYVQKPYHPNDIINAVNKVLGEVCA